MFKVDMKAIKTAMKLIAELSPQQPVSLFVHRNGAEWMTRDSDWTLLVPFDCETDIENTTLKMSCEAFMDIYKGLRAVRKELTIEINKEQNTLSFLSQEEVMVGVPYLSMSIKEKTLIPKESLSSYKIDDMLSFLNSVYAFKNNKFTPIDARVEIHFSSEWIKFVHFTHIKMTQLLLKNESKKEFRPVVIPTKELAIAYNLFKNSLEFDGEIHVNDNVILFATKRFKLGIKKEHTDLVSYDHLFNQDSVHTFRFNDALMAQLYDVKKNLKVLETIEINQEIVALPDGKIKPTKDDIMIRMVEKDNQIKIEPYLCRASNVIGTKANGSLSFYDMSTLYEMANAFVEPGFTVKILSNQVLRFENGPRNVSTHLLPIVPICRHDDEAEIVDN